MDAALRADLDRVVRAALAEDLGEAGQAADLTTVSTVDAGAHGTGEVVAKAHGVVCGLEALEAVFAALDAPVEVRLDKQDGDRVAPGDVVAVTTGPVRALLTGERTALNLITHLSGVATLTAAYVAEAGPAELTDIRKTIPGLRAMQKYAVRCGGGRNHRMSLSDAVLVKDNHIVAAGGVAEAVRRAKRAGVPVEIECASVEEMLTAIAEGADAVLLDNFDAAGLRAAVRAAREANPAVFLEASGGVTLERVREIAATGVDRISVGAVTHSAPALDFSFGLVRVRREG